MNSGNPTHQEATSGFSNPSNTSYPTQLPGDSSQGLGTSSSDFDSRNVNPSSTVQPLGDLSQGRTDPLGDSSKRYYTGPPTYTDPTLHDPSTGNAPQSHIDDRFQGPTDLNRGNDCNFPQGTGPSNVGPTSNYAPQYPLVPPKDTSPSTSTATTHGSVSESTTPTQAAQTNPLDTSDKTNEEPSTLRGVKNTVTGSLKKLAGAVTGNEERKLAGEIKKQEGMDELNAAKDKRVDKGNSYGRGDLEGTHIHDDDVIKTAGGHTADINPSRQAYGRGGLGGAEIGEDPAFVKANTGKGVMGPRRGDLKGLETKEE